VKPGGLIGNAASLVGGRLLLSIGRLGTAIAVTRLAGAERFGEYALLVSLVLLFEWLVDFGQTDIAVREICRNPEDEPALLAALGRAKRWIVLLLVPALPLLVLALGHGAALARAAAIGAIGVGAYALLQPDRAHLKARMRMERDVGAEIAGLIVSLPLTVLVLEAGLGLDALMAATAAGRIVHAALLRYGASLAPRGGPRAGAYALARQALPLGLAGLLVAIYDGLAPLMLAQLLDFGAVARYAAAARYVFPVVMIVQAVNAAFFPMLSRQWHRPDGGLAALQQTALDGSLLIAGAMFAGIHAAAPVLMGLVGPELAPAAPLLRLLAWLVLARAVTTAMSPLIVVAGRQDRALWLTIASIAVQLAAIWLLVPRLGVTGVAIGYLGVELIVGVGPVSLIGCRVARVRLDWSRPIRIVTAAVIAALAIDASPFAGGWIAGFVAPLLFVALAGASGVLGPAMLRTMRERVPA
jgi:O-antigen/teichoic acid export membrane protein